MYFIKQFTYWTVGIFFFSSVGFSIVACIMGGRDLVRLLRALDEEEIDETDDGRAMHE